MASRSSRAGIEMSYTFAKTDRQPRANSDAPFRVLILGDFGGHSAQPDSPEALRPWAIDVADLDATLAQLVPRLQLDLGDGRSLPMVFRGMDDFHPNRLFETLDLFAPLRLLRQDLRSPQYSADALARIRAKVGESSAGAGAQQSGDSSRDASARPAATEAEGDMMSRLFGRSSSMGAGRPPAHAKPTQASPDALVEAFIRPIVASQAVASPEPDLQQVLEGVNDACAALMQSVLHHPQFRALEASWRGLSWLCNQLGEVPNIELIAVDISKAALATHWAGCTDLADSPLHALLTGAGQPESGCAPWALVVGNYEFDTGADDVQLLTTMAAIAEQIGAPFVAAGAWSGFEARIAGKVDDDTAPEWTAFRGRRESSYVGLAAPRILLRLPYGKKSDPVDSFDFEELIDPSDPSGYLWGNPAWACAALLGMSFAEEGWGFSPGAKLELSGLPVHVYRAQGESVQVPCAEAWVSSSEAERLGREGLMALQSIRGRDAVRMLRFQSLHEPPTMLGGPWE